jgi:hypothetical protein
MYMALRRFFDSIFSRKEEEIAPPPACGEGFVVTLNAAHIQRQLDEAQLKNDLSEYVIEKNKDPIQPLKVIKGKSYAIRYATAFVKKLDANPDACPPEKVLQDIVKRIKKIDLNNPNAAEQISRQLRALRQRTDFHAKADKDKLEYNTELHNLTRHEIINIVNKLAKISSLAEPQTQKISTLGVTKKVTRHFPTSFMPHPVTKPVAPTSQVRQPIHQPRSRGPH